MDGPSVTVEPAPGTSNTPLVPPKPLTGSGADPFGLANWGGAVARDRHEQAAVRLEGDPPKTTAYWHSPRHRSSASRATWPPERSSSSLPPTIGATSRVCVAPAAWVVPRIFPSWAAHRSSEMPGTDPAGIIAGIIGLTSFKITYRPSGGALLVSAGWQCFCTQKTPGAGYLRRCLFRFQNPRGGKEKEDDDEFKLDRPIEARRPSTPH